MPNTDTMTHDEALLWLAGLEQVCRDCTVKDDIPCNCYACAGSGKAPVLSDLRKPCPLLNDSPPWPWTQTHHELRGINCECQGRGWVPKLGEIDLHRAMNKAGWDSTIHTYSNGARHVTFYRFPEEDDSQVIRGDDADDWVAAANAIQEAGGS